MSYTSGSNTITVSGPVIHPVGTRQTCLPCRALASRAASTADSSKPTVPFSPRTRIERNGRRQQKIVLVEHRRAPASDRSPQRRQLAEARWRHLATRELDALHETAPEEVLASADFLSVNMPLEPGTRRLIDTRVVGELVGETVNARA